MLTAYTDYKHKIIELPISILNQISGGTDKPVPPKPEPKPEPSPKIDPWTNPAFYVIWDWD